MEDAKRTPQPDVYLTSKSGEESMLRNLLAVIHRDGGHYVAAHGIAKACEDAEAKVAELFAARNGLAEDQQTDNKDSAPVAQVVAPLTEDERDELFVRYADGCTGPKWDLLIQAAAASKWGLTLKEST